MSTPSGNSLIALDGAAILDTGVAALLADGRVAGVTLYRHLNVESAQQTRRLTEELAAAAGRPLLVGVDQEGGQLLGAGAETTHFAGNMALGAADDLTLTFDVAAAIGRELRALGINVNYAPVADVATRPDNPSLGVRSFGDDPVSVADHTAAFVRGLQNVGVAATLKHFPGKGEAEVDPHDQLPLLELDADRLNQIELVPFRAGIGAGARLLMVGHYSLPLVSGDRDLPVSASPKMLQDLIRDQLGFGGLIVTDALDMGGFNGVEPEAPLQAGADLLLYGPRQVGKLPTTPARPSPRLAELLDWIAKFPTPEPSVVGCEDHQELAARLASRAITLIRDEAGLIPVRLPATAKVLAIMPHPTDLTPADTSSLVAPALAASIRELHPVTDELVVGFEPTRSDISGVATAAASADLVVVGTIQANRGQAALVEAVLATGTSTVTVAMRTPYDLGSYASAPTHLCTYDIARPSLDALAAALFGAEIRGRLPAAIPGLYPRGHGIDRTAR